MTALRHQFGSSVGGETTSVRTAANSEQAVTLQPGTLFAKQRGSFVAQGVECGEDSGHHRLSDALLAVEHPAHRGLADLGAWAPTTGIRRATAESVGAICKVLATPCGPAFISLFRVMEPAYVRDMVSAYDAVAGAYAHLLRNELAAKPVDMALLGLFAYQVQLAGGGPVADLGCGTGRVLAVLARLGVQGFGLDRSPGMIAQSRSAHSELPVGVASMAALPLHDEGLAGAVAWYSLIHTPLADLPTLVGEIARVVRPGGLVLVAFQAGDERIRLTEAYGHSVTYEVYRLRPDHLVELAEAVGLELWTRVTRSPTEREKTPQAFLLFRRRVRRGATARSTGPEDPHQQEDEPQDGRGSVGDGEDQQLQMRWERAGGVQRREGSAGQRQPSAITASPHSWWTPSNLRARFVAIEKVLSVLALSAILTRVA